MASVRGHGLAAVTGCGHSGIINILRHIRGLTGAARIHAVLGGFHLSGTAFEPIIGAHLRCVRRVLARLPGAGALHRPAGQPRARRALPRSVHPERRRNAVRVRRGRRLIMSQPSNTVTIEAWNGLHFDRFVRFRDIVTTGLSAHGEHGLRLHPPRPGDRTLDVGCGFGDTTRQLAELVGPRGEVVGVDAAPRFIDTARREAAQAGVANARFLVAAIQACELDGGLDYVSRASGRCSSPIQWSPHETCGRRSSPVAASAWRGGDASSTTTGCTAPSWSSSGP